MRVLLTALGALLLSPAAAGAAPWDELPFQPVGALRTVECVQAVGGGRVAIADDDNGLPQTVELWRVGVDGSLAREAGTELIDARDCPIVAANAAGAAVVVGDPDDGRLQVALREPGGAFVPQRVRGGASIADESAQVAMAPDGTAVLAWTEIGRGVDPRRAADPGRRVRRTRARRRPARLLRRGGGRRGEPDDAGVV